MQAALIGDVTMMEYMLDKPDRFDVDIRQVDRDGWNCLQYATHGKSFRNHYDEDEKMIPIFISSCFKEPTYVGHNSRRN